MFEFGRELRRIFRNHGRVETDPSLFELLNLKLLITQGRALDIEGGRVSTKNRFTPYIEAAQIWREYARRTGDPAAVRRAASAAENAGKEAKTALEGAQAVLEQALTCILSCDLFETWELLSSAEKLLAEGRVVVAGDEAVRARFNRAEAMLAARIATRQGIADDLEPALLAMSHIDRAIERADAQMRRTGAARDRIDAAQARFERGDLLMLVGVDRADLTLMEAVIRDFEALRVRLDAAYEPITYARVVLRLAQANIYKGQIEGAPESIAEGIALLTDDDNLIEYEHSPLDWVEQRHLLAMGLQAMAELTMRDEVFDKAMAVYDQALKRPLQKPLRLRAQVVNNRAACQARHAELKGDLNALDAAESAFKTELRGVRANDDPVNWAILQTNLARLYVARGDITGFMTERAEAAYALEAAHDIFVEHGMKSLGRTAMEYLDRVREH